ncbi:MAG TPA: enoyl-CoA hydratase [Acidimicrobiales bacterium]
MIRTQTTGHVLELTIDRPDRRNAVDHAMLDVLAVRLGEPATEGVRVAILTGAGGHFCAGADLTGVEDQAFVALLQQVLERLASAPFVTIAAVDGAALGAGTQFAVACDLRVATEEARFGIPAAKLGLAVDTWTVGRLALLAGHGTARSMLLAAETVDGATAHRLGLVQRIGTLDDARAWAHEIAALAPLTIQAHKAALHQVSTPPPPTALARDARDRAWSSADLQEGLAAFRDRRPPDFRGQ